MIEIPLFSVRKEASEGERERGTCHELGTSGELFRHRCLRSLFRFLKHLSLSKVSLILKILKHLAFAKAENLACAQAL